MSEEEYDVASSLLLLASGRPKQGADDQSRSFISNFDHDRFECTSCKKVFGSHQALGGHRASHKNTKGCFAIAKIDSDEYGDRNDVVLGGGHKCGICLRVFSSGQALGGHKRCHWEKYGDDSPLSIRALSSVVNGGLDLNLPAALEEFDYSSIGPTLDLRLGL